MKTIFPDAADTPWRNFSIKTQSAVDRRRLRVLGPLLFVLARIFMALHEIFFRLIRLRQVKISICLDSVLATDSDYLTGPGVVQ